MTAHDGTVRMLIAARNYQRAMVVASRKRLQIGQWRLLSYENHRAFPSIPLYVDHTWADHRDPGMIEALVARRILMATDQRLGPDSRAVIARDGV